ncbi:XkdX family protein [Bacillus sp. SW14]
MNSWFDTIKDYYDDDLWTPEMIKQMVPLGILTSDEYEAITWEKYEV